MTESADARQTALKVLLTLERREAYAEALLDGEFSRSGADRRDRGFTTALVYGVLRHQLTLDRYIEAAASRKMVKIHPKVAAILRLGAFQLLHMDRVPPSAAVDTSVKAARNGGLAHAAGFVNAVLRRISEGALLPVAEDEVDALLLAHSLPRWLMEAWIAAHGLEGATAMAAHSASEPPLYLRADTNRLTLTEAIESIEATGAKAGKGRWAHEALWVLGGSDPRALPPVADKLAVVQGQASQLIAPLLEVQPGMSVLDACAAPGMKTLHLARFTEGKGRLVALDIHPHRVRRIEEAARDHGIRNIEAKVADASTFGGAEFDRVLVDAPCTGLGVLARNPERKWRLTAEDPARMAALSHKILANAANLVRPGGLVVYATCSTAREENQGVVEQFLRENPAFEPSPPNLPVELSDGKGNLSTYPPVDATTPEGHLDGFFAARFRRRTS